MAGTIAPEREAARAGRRESWVTPDQPWITIVWNDPINLMSYVTHVFMTVFGYEKAKAEKLMLDVHQRGRAVVSSGTARAHGARRQHPARLRPVGHAAAETMTVRVAEPATAVRLRLDLAEAHVLTSCSSSCDDVLEPGALDRVRPGAAAPVPGRLPRRRRAAAGDSAS